MDKIIKKKEGADIIEGFGIRLYFILNDTNSSILGSTNYCGKAIHISQAGSPFGSWREDGLV